MRWSATKSDLLLLVSCWGLELRLGIRRLGVLDRVEKVELVLLQAQRPAVGLDRLNRLVDPEDVWLEVLLEHQEVLRDDVEAQEALPRLNYVPEAAL